MKIRRYAQSSLEPGSLSDLKYKVNEVDRYIEWNRSLGESLGNNAGVIKSRNQSITDEMTLDKWLHTAKQKELSFCRLLQ